MMPQSSTLVQERGFATARQPHRQHQPVGRSRSRRAAVPPHVLHQPAHPSAANGGLEGPDDGADVAVEIQPLPTIEVSHTCHVTCHIHRRDFTTRWASSNAPAEDPQGTTQGHPITATPPPGKKHTSGYCAAAQDTTARWKASIGRCSPAG